MKCPKCNGLIFRKIYPEGASTSPCDFCWGKEELDWVELILGVEHPVLEGFAGSCGYSGISSTVSTPTREKVLKPTLNFIPNGRLYGYKNVK